MLYLLARVHAKWAACKLRCKCLRRNDIHASLDPESMIATSRGVSVPANRLFLA